MKAKLFTTLFFLICGSVMFAQTYTVNGKVIDKSNEPLIGVTVSVKVSIQ